MSNIIETVQNTIKNWWIPALVGVIFVLVGITTFGTPNEAFQGLSLVFSISFIVIGVLEIFFAFSNRETMEGWGWLLTLGILTLMVGILLTRNQEVAQTTLPIYVSFLILFRSILGISTAIDLKSAGDLEWGTIMLVSVLAMILSFIMLFNPELAAVSIVFWTGAIFLLVGIVSIVFGLRLRRIKRTPQRLQRQARNAVNDIRNKAADMVDDVRDGAQDAVDNVRDTAKNIADNVSDAVDNAADNIKDAAKNLGKNKDS